MTSDVKEKPKFNIIEGYEPDIDYDEFKKDFLNPYILVKELLDKYRISKKVYREYRDKILKETGLWKKPNIAQQRSVKGTPFTRECKNAEYIQRINGDYVVVKTIGYTTTYYGRYDDYETARMVRDILVKNNWNNEIGMELKALYGKKHLKPSLEKAKEVYDEYETRYFFDREHTLEEIKHDLGIKGRTYDYLRMLLREKHGSDVRRAMYD